MGDSAVPGLGPGRSAEAHNGEVVAADLRGGLPVVLAGGLDGFAEVALHSRDQRAAHRHDDTNMSVVVGRIAGGGAGFLVHNAVTDLGGTVTEAAVGVEEADSTRHVGLRREVRVLGASGGLVQPAHILDTPLGGVEAEIADGTVVGVLASVHGVGDVSNALRLAGGGRATIDQILGHDVGVGRTRTAPDDLHPLGVHDLRADDLGAGQQDTAQGGGSAGACAHVHGVVAGRHLHIAARRDTRGGGGAGTRAAAREVLTRDVGGHDIADLGGVVVPVRLVPAGIGGFLDRDRLVVLEATPVVGRGGGRLAAVQRAASNNTSAPFSSSHLSYLASLFIRIRSAGQLFPLHLYFRQIQRLKEVRCSCRKSEKPVRFSANGVHCIYHLELTRFQCQKNNVPVNHILLCSTLSSFPLHDTINKKRGGECCAGLCSRWQKNQGGTNPKGTNSGEIG